MQTKQRWIARCLAVFPVVFACNSILDNDPIPVERPGSGGTSGAAGASGSDSQLAGAAGGGAGGEGGLDASAGAGGEDHSASTENGSGGGSTVTGNAGTSSTTGEGASSAAATTGAAGTGGGGGTMICDPGPEPETEQACCGTGTRTRTVTLDAGNCTYNLGEWSACSVPETCQPGATKNCDNNDSCGIVRCNDQCAWGVCEPKVAGGCLRIRIPNNTEGTNYECCAPGAWHFCLPECVWPVRCEACDPDFCEC
jgi:hypothetical protein